MDSVKTTESNIKNSNVASVEVGQAPKLENLPDSDDEIEVSQVKKDNNEEAEAEKGNSNVAKKEVSFDFKIQGRVVGDKYRVACDGKVGGIADASDYKLNFQFEKNEDNFANIKYDKEGSDPSKKLVFNFYASNEKGPGMIEDLSSNVLSYRSQIDFEDLMELVRSQIEKNT